MPRRRSLDGGEADRGLGSRFHNMEGETMKRETQWFTAGDIRLHVTKEQDDLQIAVSHYNRDAQIFTAFTVDWDTWSSVEAFIQGDDS